MRMYTSVMLVALAGSGAVPSAPAEAPSWQADYSAARREGRRAGKPLAVFVARGAEGWGKVSTTGKLSPAARRLLAERYVCVYVDSAAARGRRLAEAFELTNGTGLVLSSRDGQDQAFRHEGRLSAAELERCLRSYSGRRAVARTENLQTQEVRTSFYYAPSRSKTRSAPAAPASTPVYGSFGGYGGGFGGYGGYGGFGGGFGGGRSGGC
jgi:hypothetical protein